MENEIVNQILRVAYKALPKGPNEKEVVLDGNVLLQSRDEIDQLLSDLCSHKGKEFILCAAIHFKNGAPTTVKGVESGVVVCGRRHADCYAALQGIIGEVDPSTLPDRDDQGFLTSFNRYVGREEGFNIAKANGQILRISPLYGEDQQNRILASEDLY